MANQTDKATIDLVINGQQSEASLKSIATAATNARKALYSMAETDPGYAKQKRELEALMEAQKQRIVKIHEEKTAWQKFTAGTGSIMAGVTGANLLETGIRAIGGAISAGVQSYREYNAASQELSAVTGATGKDLEYLNETAKQTGPGFGKSAAEMLEAYKLMASAKPELLDQKELLTQTTEAAIALAQAGKIDLAEATKVTAESLNQFGESADQANRYVNVIAAGAKEGSAEINEMGMALKNSGTVASAQDVSFEQTNAVLQSMSTIALKGGEAGTQLRNVLLTLGSGAKDTNPKVVGLEKALENLGKKNLSTAEMTKLFGKENITAAQHIITHRGEIAELTTKLTGTSEAFTQAEKNNATFDHQLEVFWARLNSIAVAIGTRVVPALSYMMEKGIALMKFLSGNAEPAVTRVTGAFNEQRQKTEQLTKQMEPLLSRYQELAKKAKLSKDEQAELAKLTDQISSIMPGAVTQFDKYGNAIAVSTVKARELIEAQKEMQRQMKAGAIEEQKQQLRNLEYQRKQIMKRLATREDVTVAASGNVTVTPISPADIKQLQADLADNLKQVNETVRQMRATEGQTPIEERRAARRGTKPEVVKPKVEAPEGETPAEKKAREKKEKAAERQRQKEIKAAGRHEDELERLMTDARSRTAKEEADTFTAEQVQFGARYARMYELANANKDKMEAVTSLMYKELAAIELKEDQRKYKEGKKKQDRLIKDADEELKLRKKSALAAVDERVAGKFITKEEGNLEKLQVEAQFLEARELLYDAHYEVLRTMAGENAELLGEIATESKDKQAEIDAEQTTNTTEQATARTDIRTDELKREEEQLEKKKRFAHEEKEFRAQVLGELASMLMADWTGTLQGYKDYWKQATLVQKAALIASKAWALAEIGINLARQISLVNTAATVMDAVVPFSGEAFRIKGLATAIGTAALQTAKVVAVGLQVPQFGDGGFTPSDKEPSGFTTGSTYFTQGNFIAGEKGQEWIMSAPMLANPVFANLAGALQAIQASGAYRSVSPGAPGGTAGVNPGGNSGGNMSNEIALAILEQLKVNNTRMEDISKRPINYNHFKIQESEAYLAEIDVETKL